MDDIEPNILGRIYLGAADARARAVGRAVKALKGLQRTVYALHKTRGRDMRADIALRRFKVCLMAVAGELHAIIEAPCLAIEAKRSTTTEKAARAQPPLKVEGHRRSAAGCLPCSR
jgi:hypothetical protein